MGETRQGDTRSGSGGPGALNLVKLCVGADSPAELEGWLAVRAAKGGPGWTPRHTTRMQPRRAAELLEGGSLYWVFRGAIRARQKLLGVEPNTGADGIARYDLVLDRALILTAAAPRRPFQGWRYLSGPDAPADLRAGLERRREERLPPDLERALETIGVL